MTHPESQGSKEKKETPESQSSQLNTSKDVLQFIATEFEKTDLNTLLKNRIMASGRAIDGLGVCSGVSGMALQNWLLLRYDGIKKIKSRIDNVLEMKEEEFKKTDTEEKSYKYTTDMEALFDGIHSYQKTNLFPPSTNKKGLQSPLEVAPVVLSSELQEQGNLVLGYSFIDVYFQVNDLISTLEKLKTAQQKYPDQTLGFHLSKSNHKIFVGYDIVQNIWVMLDINNPDQIIFENTDSLAKRIIGSASPSKASDIPDVRMFQKKCETYPDDLREKIKQKLSHSTVMRGNFEIGYDRNTNQFIIKNPKSDPVVSIFRTEIFMISAIQKKLEESLNDLTREVDEKSSNRSNLNIELQHLTHHIKIQYNKENETWTLFDEHHNPCGNTKNTNEITRWVMSEFLTFNNVSVYQIDVQSDIKSFSIRDEKIDRIIRELDKNHWALSKNINKEKILACDRDGGTLLYLAAIDGNIDLIKQLIAAGADVNKATTKGYTPLGIASSAGWEDIVYLLLNNHAIYDTRALIAAVKSGKKNIVEIFIKQGANINEQVNSETTALVEAAKNGHLEMVKWLLDKGATNTADNKGITPLLAAANAGRIDVVKFLLERQDTNVNQAEKSGYSPLFSAAWRGHLDIVKLLLENKANIDQPALNNMTPLGIAKLKNNSDIVKFLQEKGASSAVSFSAWIDNALKKIVPEPTRNSYFSCMAALLQVKFQAWDFHFNADTGHHIYYKKNGDFNHIILNETSIISEFLKLRQKKPDNQFLHVYEDIPIPTRYIFFNVFLNEKNFIDHLVIDSSDQNKFDEFVNQLLKYVFPEKLNYFDRIEPLLRVTSLSTARIILSFFYKSVWTLKEQSIKHVIFLSELLVKFNLTKSHVFASLVKEAATKLNNDSFQLLLSEMIRQGINKEELVEILLKEYLLKDSPDQQYARHISFLFENIKTIEDVNQVFRILFHVNAKKQQELSNPIFSNPDNIKNLLKLPIDQQISLLPRILIYLQPEEKFANDCFLKIRKHIIRRYIEKTNNQKYLVAALEATCLLAGNPVNRARLTELCELIEIDHRQYKLTKSDLVIYLNDYLKKTSEITAIVHSAQEQKKEKEWYSDTMFSSRRKAANDPVANINKNVAEPSPAVTKIAGRKGSMS